MTVACRTGGVITCWPAPGVRVEPVRHGERQPSYNGQWPNRHRPRTSVSMVFAASHGNEHAQFSWLSCRETLIAEPASRADRVRRIGKAPFGGLAGRPPSHTDCACIQTAHACSWLTCLRTPLAVCAAVINANCARALYQSGLKLLRPSHLPPPGGWSRFGAMPLILAVRE